MPRTKEQIKIYNANYRAKNKEKIKVDKAQEYLKNKEKNRARHLKNTYGISVNDYNDMFVNQNGCCKICNKHQKNINNTLCVDHCHETGKVRGLLCHNCNTMLGKAFDSKEILLTAIKYLEEPWQIPHPARKA
jgi:hypothetical protein